MIAESLQAIQTAFDQQGSRFIVVGGLATIAHGYLRATTDIDIVIELLPQNIQQAFAALGSVGYKSNAPISAEQLADPTTRRSLIDEKNMTVLQFWSDQHPAVSVDVFVEQPFEFETEWKASLKQSIDANTPALHFASLETLIAMKEKAGRPQDLADLEHLRLIEKEQEGL